MRKKNPTKQIKAEKYSVQIDAMTITGNLAWVTRMSKFGHQKDLVVGDIKKVK